MSKINNLVLIFLTIFCLTNCQNKVLKKEIIISDFFVKGTEDVPLLIDMEQENDNIIYSANRHRNIIYSSYKSFYQPQQIKNFYKKRLKSLDWNISEINDDFILFKREDQELKIAILQPKKQKYFIVKFFLYHIN